MPVIFAHFPEGVVGAIGAIAVADGFRVEKGDIGFVPTSVFADALTYTTLNYHIVPAFLHRNHAGKEGALTVPIPGRRGWVDLNPYGTIH
jgi:hypothetical protein